MRKHLTTTTPPLPCKINHFSPWDKGPTHWSLGRLRVLVLFIPITYSFLCALGLNFKVLNAPSTALGRYIGCLSSLRWVPETLCSVLLRNRLSAVAWAAMASECLRGARRIQLECKLCSRELVATGREKQVTWAGGRCRGSRKQRRA